MLPPDPLSLWERAGVRVARAIGQRDASALTRPSATLARRERGLETDCFAGTAGGIYGTDPRAGGQARMSSRNSSVGISRPNPASRARS